MTIIITEVSMAETSSMNVLIPEFNIGDIPAGYFEERCAGRTSVVFTANVDNEPAGFLIAYDRYYDSSIFCWRVGVVPKFRRCGILAQMMKRLEEWCASNEYGSIKTAVKNSQREMLAYLVKEGYIFLDVSPKDDTIDNAILLEKTIDQPQIN